MTGPIKGRLLIVEDDPGLVAQLRWCFEDYDLAIASNRAEAVAAMRSAAPAVVLQDLGLPPDAEGTTEGFATLTELLELQPRVKVVVVTGNNERASAVRAVSLGAYDFYQKPIDADALRLAVNRAFHIAALEAEVAQLRSQSPGESLDGIIATDARMLKVCRTIEKVAKSDISVLILGESGTGKELIARAVHSLSERRDQPFQAINCAAIPEQLLESELFGHEKGAFTGAIKTKPGKVEFANKGTMFLDEIGDMPLSLQSKLLRFLQNSVIERVGGHQEIPVDVRIVAATNQNLPLLIRENRFRQDLYYRLSQIEVQVPPLRDRPSDILAMANVFLSRFAPSADKRKSGFTPGALAEMVAYSWPGNVRELENKIKVACLLGNKPMVTAEDLALGAADRALPLSLKDARNRAERDALERALSVTSGNITHAADVLGVSRPTLYNLMSRHGLSGQ